MSEADPSDKIPIIGRHRGVGLHDQQSPARLETVRRDIDRAFKVRTIREGLEFVKDAKNAPEARLCMEARLESRFASAVRGRERRPTLDLDHLHAWTTGLESQTWRSPHHYGSMLDKYDGTPRETPLQKSHKKMSDGGSSVAKRPPHGPAERA